ncbi:MAG: DUF222 domain-containing protein [Actinomycetota bacterium]|nr:DUF222 domain-containing protein [Actinomycetota bacterium]
MDEHAFADLEARVRGVCGHLNVLHGELVQLAAEALDTNLWAVPGVTSIQHWLTWQAGITATHADTVVRLARARVTHPQTMAVFADGAISFDQAAIAVKAPGYLDGEFAELAQYATVAQLRLLVRAAKPSPCPKPPAPDPVESLSGWFDDDGRYHLRGDLDPDHGRIVDAALGEARDALFQAGQTDVTTAEALVEMAQRSLDGASRAAGTVPGQLVHRPHPPSPGDVDRRLGRPAVADRPPRL